MYKIRFKKTLSKFLTIVAFLFMAACASNSNFDNGKLQFESRQLIGSACNQSLETARQWIESNTLVLAEQELINALDVSCLKGYEKSQLHRLLAYVMFAQKKYPQAINAYQYVVESKYLDVVTRSEAVYTRAQIQFLTGDYKAVIDGIKLAVKDELLLDEKTDLLLARGYYRIDSYDNALDIMKRLVTNSEDQGDSDKYQKQLALICNEAKLPKFCSY